MGNKVTFGLRNLHVAFRDTDDSSGAIAYEAPIHIPGAVGFKPSPEGDETKFYADDTLFFTATKNDGYTADVDVALIPDAVIARMLGYEIDANGAVIEDADALPVPFAIMFEVAGDERQRRTVYYECRAARPSREEKTKEANITPGTDTIKLTITPVEINDMYVVRAVMEANDANSGVDGAFTTFFESVYMPEPVA